MDDRRCSPAVTCKSGRCYPVNDISVGMPLYRYRYRYRCTLASSSTLPSSQLSRASVSWATPSAGAFSDVEPLVTPNDGTHRW
jgi:hypothetical protein